MSPRQGAARGAQGSESTASLPLGICLGRGGSGHPKTPKPRARWLPAAPAPPRGRVCCLLRALAWQVGRKRAVLVKSRARFVPRKSNPVPQLSRPRHQPRHQAEKETSAAEMLQKKPQGHSRSESSPALRPLHLSELPPFGRAARRGSAPLGKARDVWLLLS